MAPPLDVLLHGGTAGRPATPLTTSLTAPLTTPFTTPLATQPNSRVLHSSCRVEEEQDRKDAGTKQSEPSKWKNLAVNGREVGAPGIGRKAYMRREWLANSFEK